jgi:preprotein translocase SecE subunit
MGVVQYLKDTRSELNHVAWPTRVQTIVFTILVIAISILISLYLGFLDFAFTRGLAKMVQALPHQSVSQEIPLDQLQISTTTVATTTQSK